MPNTASRGGTLEVFMKQVAERHACIMREMEPLRAWFKSGSINFDPTSWCERWRDFGPSAFRKKLNEIDEWCPHPLRRSPRCIVPDSRHLMNTRFSIVVYMYQLIRHGPWNLSKNDQAGGEDIPISMPCMSYWLSMVVITEWSCRVLSVYFAIYQKEKRKKRRGK